MPPIDLDQILELGRASRYANPRDSTAILPRVYGDFTAIGGLPNDHEDGGFLPAVEIDRLNWVFLLNDGPVPASPRPTIYAEDVAQVDNDQVYFWLPSFDYEGRGHPISAILFNVDPGGRQISWRGPATINQSTGQLITNPIDALADAFGYLGGWTASDIDPASVAQTKTDMTTLGDTIHWCFSEDLSYRVWLHEILRHYHTDFWEQENGALRVMLDRSVTTLPCPILKIVNADTDLIRPMKPDDYVLDTENLFNTARISRRKKWTTNTYTDIPTVAWQSSVNVYGHRFRSFELPACYTDAEGVRWFNGMLTRYALKPATITFTVRGLSLLPALPGTFLGFLWPEQGWTSPRLVKVIAQSVDPWNQHIRFTCFDCQRTVTDQVILPTTPIVEARRRIAERGVTVDLVPPGPASNLVPEGAYREIVLRWDAPSDLDYDRTEVWAAVVNNRATAICVRNCKGIPGQRQEETFAVADGSSYFVWLMTVDRSDNGQNGGSGVTGGNWYPSSPTGGIPAAPVLVDTGGIQVQGVTFTHFTNARATVQAYLGEHVVADAVLDGLFQQGHLIAFAPIQITFGSLHTAILQIKQGGLTGIPIGRAYLPNLLNSQVSPPIDCWGMDFTPIWTGFYVVTVQVINQNGAQVDWVLVERELFLLHTKR